MAIEDVMRVLKLRQAAIRVTSSKLQRGLDATRDAPALYGMKTFFAAHTGRYSSHGLQIDNLPRGAEGVDFGILDNLSLETVDAEAKRLGVSADDVLSTLIRPCLIAQGEGLSIGDFNAIECRILAWLANEHRMLRLFRDGGSPYCDFASTALGRPITKADKAEYFLGKTVILGAGYQLSHKKFADFCRVKRLNLVGCTPKQLIEGYRKKYPLIPRLWRLYDKAIKKAVAGEAVQAGRCGFRREGTSLLIRLPSGNELTYRNARIEDRMPLYAKYEQSAQLKPTVVYDGPRGERVLYGGKVTENIDQAIGAELLSLAMSRCEAAGLKPVFSVHDELVCESADVETLRSMMEQVPEWAAGLPVKAECFHSVRYRK